MYAAPRGIPFLSAKLRGWEASVPRLGGSVAATHDPVGVTHVLVGSSLEGSGLPASLMERCSGDRSGPYVVHYTWLERSIQNQRKEDETAYPPVAAGTEEATKPSPPPSERPHENPRCRRWLGEELWTPACADMSLTELALQVTYACQGAEGWWSIDSCVLWMDRFRCMTPGRVRCAASRERRHGTRQRVRRNWGTRQW